MIDIKNYTKRKEAGLLSIAKVGSGFAVSQKKFDPETGKEVTPMVAGFHTNDIEKVKTSLQEAIANADALLADINSL